jgi:hypothetical protein
MKLIISIPHLKAPFSAQDGTAEDQAWGKFSRWAGLIIAAALLGFVLATVLP